MNRCMTPNLRFMECIIAAAIAHFLITLLLLGFAAGGAMARIPDHGAGPIINAPVSAVEQVVQAILWVLLLPLLPLMSHLSTDGPMFVLPFILNSLLWGVFTTLLVRFIFRRIRR